MAPQPLHRVIKDPKFSLTGGAWLGKQPQLGAALASVIAAWSEAEMYYGAILIQLLGGNSGPALAMLHALTSTSAQDQAIEAAAATMLADDEMILFTATLTVARRNRKVRHSLAHGCIIQCDDLPDSLIVADPRDFHKLWKLVFGPSPAHADRNLYVKEAIREFSKVAQVWKKSDLDEVADRFRSVSDMLINLAVMVTPFHHGRDKALDELRSQPLIAAELRCRVSRSKTRSKK